MNEHVRTRSLGGAAAPIRTIAALQGRRWTTAELLALITDGRLDPDLEYELIDGEVVAMPPEGEPHQDLRHDLTDNLFESRQKGIRVAAEPQFNLTADMYVKADIVVHPATIRMSALRGPDALLVIEIADSSLDYDTTTKAALYARHGVREYWVVEARTRVTHVFEDPTATGYSRRGAHPPTERLVPRLAPGLSLRLADLPPNS